MLNQLTQPGSSVLLLDPERDHLPFRPRLSILPIPPNPILIMFLHQALLMYALYHLPPLIADSE